MTKANKKKQKVKWKFMVFILLLVNDNLST